MKVYRALSIPNLCMDKFVEEYDTGSFCNIWIEIIIETLGEATVLFAEFLDQLPEEHKNKITALDRILFLTDMYTWLLKSPAYLDPIRKVIHSPYRIYVYERIRRLLGFKLGDDVNNFIFMITKYCKEPIMPECMLAENIINLADKIREKLDKIHIDWKMILGYPADTRPGYNSTSLLVHSILVSGISWSIAVTKRFSEEKAALYALAGILHDIGKPCDPEHHVRKTIELIEGNLRQALERVIGERNYIELIDMIRKHHSGDEILRRADILAAGERSQVLVEEILSRELKNVVEETYNKLSEMEKTKFKAIYDNTMNLYYGLNIDRQLLWEFWRKIGTDKIKMLTEKFARGVWGINLVDKLEREKPAHEPDKEKLVYALIVDISSIQKIVNDSLDLRIMAVNSYLIDVWLMSELPNLLLSRYKVPLSAIVMNTGGNSLVILPGSIVERIRRDIEEDFNRLDYALLELTINTAVQVFDPDYMKLFSGLTRKLYIAKRTMKTKHTVIHPGINNSFCELCGVRPAQTILRIGGEEKLVCLECRIRHDVASKIVYSKSKKRFFDAHKVIYEREKLVTENINGSYKTHSEIFHRIFEKLIEYISGLPNNEKYYGRLLNYSVVSIDGNIMGFYMSLSPTFTSAVEKSLLIDYALKKAYSEFIDKVIDILEQEIGDGTGYHEASRLILGYLYMGGDDAKLVVPSHLALPLVLYLSKRFHELTNCTMTLSIGIASGPTKHSVWGLNDTSIGLMDEYSKPDGRKAAYEALKAKKPGYVATLQLYNTESTSMLTRQRVSQFYGKYLGNTGKGLVVKRFIIAPNPKGGPDNLHYILEKISEYLNPGPNSRDLIDRLISLGYRLIVNQCRFIYEKDKKEKCLHYYLGKSYTSIPEEVEQPLKRLRKLRSVLNEALSIYEKFKDTGDPATPVLLYLKRQIARLERTGIKTDKMTEYHVLLDLVMSGFNKKYMQNISATPLLSYLILIKTMGGGVL